MTVKRSTEGLDLALELRRGEGRLHVQLEEALRAAIRDGRLVAGTPLPASRGLAGELGVARSVVTEAYGQLGAEGWLEVRARALPRVAHIDAVAAEDAGAAEPQPPPRYDLRPGAPDLALFPRTEWLKSVRAALNAAPDRALGYGPVEGVPAARATLAAYLGRVRAVHGAGRPLICQGVAQALVVAVRAIELERGRPAVVAVEDPSHADVRAILSQHSVRLLGVPVDGEGAIVDAIPSEADALVVTPAHQFPLGVVLSPERRLALAARARSDELWVIEDDYDAEHRYDRAPVGALQAIAPDRVVSLGSVSKTLAPALRLGWLVTPAGLRPHALAARAALDRGAPTIDQLALADFIARGALDRHVRRSRRTYRRRRDALVAALPQARVGGIAAGLHLTLAIDNDELAVQAAAARRGVAVDTLGRHRIAPGDPALLLGYGNLSEGAIAPAVARLRDAAAM
jgi:GntR family transcriptional regulator / MocR family aminotransferase